MIYVSKLISWFDGINTRVPVSISIYKNTSTSSSELQLRCSRVDMNICSNNPLHANVSNLYLQKSAVMWLIHFCAMRIHFLYYLAKHCKRFASKVIYVSRQSRANTYFGDLWNKKQLLSHTQFEIYQIQIKSIFIKYWYKVN